MTQATASLETAAQPGPVRLVATLLVAGLLSGLAIVSAYEWTKPIIARNDAAALARAVLRVVPGSTRMQGIVLDDAGPRAVAAGESTALFAAYDEAGAFRGFAIASEGAGFQDVIRLIYGFDPATRRVVGLEILDSRETPGLGDKIYKDPAFDANFDALAVEPPIVCVKHGAKTADHEVDAITGATISSKAVVRIVGEANAAWLDRLPAADAVPPAPAGGEGGAR